MKNFLPKFWPSEFPNFYTFYYKFSFNMSSISFFVSAFRLVLKNFLCGTFRFSGCLKNQRKQNKSKNFTSLRSTIQQGMVATSSKMTFPDG